MDKQNIGKVKSRTYLNLQDRLTTLLINTENVVKETAEVKKLIENHPNEAEVKELEALSSKGFDKIEKLIDSL